MTNELFAVEKQFEPPDGPWFLYFEFQDIKTAEWCVAGQVELAVKYGYETQHRIAKFVRQE
jgi:hypothetical protein